MPARAARPAADRSTSASYLRSPAAVVRRQGPRLAGHRRGRRSAGCAARPGRAHRCSSPSPTTTATPRPTRCRWSHYDEPRRAPDARVRRRGDRRRTASAGYVYDALHDKDATDAAGGTASPSRPTGDGWAFHRDPPSTELPAGGPSLVVGAEQSNTSLDLRRHRDPQGVPQGLARAQPRHRGPRGARRGRQHAHRADRSAGSRARWTDGRGRDRSTASLAMAQAFLADATEGWELAKASVRDLYAEADLHADEVGGDFAGEAHRLGAATAEVHAALADALPHRRRSNARSSPRWPTAMRGPAGPGRRRGARARRRTPSALRAAFDDLAALDDAGRGAAGARRLPPRPGDARPSTAGSCSTSRASRPGRSAERRALDSPVQDVAGMLRSFDYAARHLLADHPADAQREYRATEWAERNRDAFCDGLRRRPAAPTRAADAGAAARVRDRQGGLRGPLRGAQPADLAADPHGGDPPARRRPRSERATHRRAHRRPAGTRPTQPADRATAAPGPVCRRGAAPARLRRAPRPAPVLGPHPHDGGVTVRALRPWATAVTVVIGDAALRHAARGRTASGSASCPARRSRLPARGRLRRRRPRRVDDPYRFLPTLGEIDLHLIGEGRHEQLWTVLGAHTRAVRRLAGTVTGTSFAVWAPQRPGRAARRRLQLLGRPRPPDALAGLDRRVGAVRPRRRRRHALQVRGPRPRRRVAAEGRPDGVPRRGAAGDRVGRVHLRRTSGATATGCARRAADRPADRRR